MNHSATDQQTEFQIWNDQNKRYLVSRWRAVQHRLETGVTSQEPIDFSESDKLAAEMARPPALVSLANTFSLSEFEQHILLLCAGYELDSGFSQAIRSTPQTRPTFELALGLFPSGHWSAVTPVAPLRHWRFIELGQADNLADGPVRIDERILHYLSGISYLDARLTGLVEVSTSSPVLAPSLNQCAEQLVSHWGVQERSGQPLLVQLRGVSEADMKSVARNACERLALIPYHISGRDIPSHHNEREALSVLWQRESLLDRTSLVVTICDDNQHTVSHFVDKLFTPCIVIGRETLPLQSGSAVRLDLPASDSSEQLALWQTSLGESAARLNGELGRIVSQFSFPAQDIVNLSHHTLSIADQDKADQWLWQQCRSHSRRRLESLAERIESSHEWEDLVLPEAQKQTLRDIVSYARHRHHVYSDWKLGAKSKRGQGGSCLFFGPSGTGKTMAASVIANELQLDLYRVDLSQLINKYIGETEKNIAKVFDMAENSGAILLFDEADSLFAKRTEVKTSNDRNANIGTSYLLQRMERYSGLAILTTNLKKEMDTAFMRRIRFATQFPFPDQSTRQRIWEKMFPPETPISSIDVGKLAGLDLAGGNIRNIALNAAFYAAEENTAVSMSHLAKAARREYRKLEKPIRENELRSWQ